MSALRFLKALRRNRTGATTIEFAILGPILFIAVLGVYQVGVGMQAYNSVRNLTSEVGRRAAVAYQKSNELNESQLEDFGKALATAPPYNLESNRVDAVVTLAETQRVTGAQEFTLTMSYDVPTLLSIMGMDDFTLTHTRPIFVSEPPAAPAEEPEAPVL